MLPSGGTVDVHWNPLVAVLPGFDRPEWRCVEIQSGIKGHLKFDPRMLEVTIHPDWRMFVIWGQRGGDCRKLPVIQLGDAEHTPDAIVRRIGDALSLFDAVN